MSRVFEYFVNVLAWLQIVASPLFAGLLIAAIVYFPNPTSTRLIIATIIVLIALLAGIIWATRIWKTKGTMWFISRISSTPDIDEWTGNNSNEKK